jgi:hypothetical protein
MDSFSFQIDFTSPYSMGYAEKDRFFFAQIRELSHYHYARCEGYRNITDQLFPHHRQPQDVHDLPFLPAAIFKSQNLLSVDPSQITRQLQSSGTTGANVSKIFIDAETSQLQIKALASIGKDFLGSARLPMVIFDIASSHSKSSAFSARTAGILGFSNFGRNHLYALNSNFEFLSTVVKEYIQTHSGSPIICFGFTWVIWKYVVDLLASNKDGLVFPEGSVLVHGGGWKRLADQNISRHEFTNAVDKRLGIRRVVDYYGMVEQVGSIFMECEEGHFHVPSFADVIFRDPASMNASDSGLVQVLSLLPRSYPGHSILTEDIGELKGIGDCPCGRHGKYFSIHGRLVKSEVRGCSDARTY